MTYAHELSLNAEHIEYAKHGSLTFRVKVLGYWSSESISIYVNRKFSYGEKPGQWEIKMSHSSGGRDSKEVESDLDAETNFGFALIQAAKFARILENHIPQFEESFQAEAARCKAEMEAEKEALEKAVQLDRGMLESDAKKLVLNAIDRAKNNSGARADIVTYKRGTDQKVVFKITAFGRAVFRKNSYVISSKEVIAQLVNEMSASRTTIVLDVK